MKAKTIILILLALGLGGATIAYLQYNKPHRDAATEKPAHEVTAHQLFAAFSNNEAEAMAEFGNKIIQVTGEIMEVTTLPDETKQVVFNVDDPIFGVKANFQKSTTTNFEEGKTITIKGICSGFNADVEMTGCVVVQ
jgi:hypothetical protein